MKNVKEVKRMKENNDIIIKECCQICEYYTTHYYTYCTYTYCTKRQRGIAPFQYCPAFKMRGAGKYFEVIDITQE